MPPWFCKSTRADMSKLQRLDKCVSHLTGMSRKSAFFLIKAGRVTLFGEVVRDPSLRVEENAQIAIDGDERSAFEGFEKRCFMFNKPRDCVCADTDKLHTTVLDYFAGVGKEENLHCAGRLDLDTTGLLLVTDDGELIHHLTSPKRRLVKVYEAVTDKDPDDHAVRAFLKGLKHPQEKKRYESAVLRPQGNCVSLVEVTEGRYHEVKRLFELCGIAVTRLKRLKIGELSLDPELEEGQFRPLSAEELALIKSDIKADPG